MHVLHATSTTKASAKTPLELSQESHALAIQPYSGKQAAVLASCTAVIAESLVKALASAGMQAGWHLSSYNLILSYIEGTYMKRQGQKELLYNP